MKMRGKIESSEAIKRNGRRKDGHCFISSPRSSVVALCFFFAVRNIEKRLQSIVVFGMTYIEAELCASVCVFFFIKLWAKTYKVSVLIHLRG